MRAHTARTRVVVLATLAAIACSSPASEKSKPVTDAGTKDPPAPASCADAGGGPYLPCDVEAIVAVKCRRCHDAPAALSDCIANKSCVQGPFPLVTWTDTRRPLGKERVVDFLEQVIASGEMPFKTNAVSPPVASLTDDEKKTLVDWAKACAPAGTTACTTAPDGGP